MAEKNTQKKLDHSISSLLIVESPAKIKTISKFLGQNFKIVSTVGHVKDLPEKKLGVEIKDNTIEIDYVPIKGKATVIANICKEAKKVDQVYLASDSDREGEMISFHIGEEIQKAVKKTTKISRIVYNELTKSAIEEAISNKHEVDLKMVAAQQARRVLDRWVGYEVSPILWKRIAKGSSAGRVQSVAVLFICNREQEILAFVPEESWSISALIKKDDLMLEAALFKIKGKAIALKNEDDAKKVLEKLQGKSLTVKEINDKQRIKNPLPPFITSSLQQDAYNKLGFSVEKTMMIAQRLYEGVSLDGSSQEALITYMRSDSTRLSDTAISDIRSFLKSSLDDNYLPKKSLNFSKSGAQDAHEAIRPVSVARTPDSLKTMLEPDFFKLYDLIWRRTVSCQMAPAIYAQRQILLDAGNDMIFKITGSTLVFDGFLKIYKPEEENEEKSSVIPDSIKVDEVLPVDKLNSKQHFTQPPPRFTEATLVKELEKMGIGRPSTYATIMTTIQKRNYVEKVSKKFVPTELGKAVTKILVDNLSDIFNVSFTAKMEEDLDKIAAGSASRDDVLLSFYEKFKKDLAKFIEIAQIERAAKTVETNLTCPKCNNAKLLIRFSRSGEFLGCSAFPQCNFTSGFERLENNEIKIVEKDLTPKELNIACPNCGKKLIERTGRYGKFAACPGYPECKYIHKKKLPTEEE